VTRPAEEVLREPEIDRRDILILEDPDFRPEHVCLITGVASGIGRAAAVAATANHLTVAGLDVNEAGGLETADLCRKFGGRMDFFRADLTRDEEIIGAVDQAAGLGRIRYLANIAGLQHLDSLADFPMDKYDLMERVMLRAPFLLAKLVIPHLKASPDGRGVIGNMASIHGHIATVQKPAYNVVKFGMRGLTQSIAAEGEGRIRSFSVSVGWVMTPLSGGQVPVLSRQLGLSPEEVIREISLGRSRIKVPMKPIEAANLFLFGFSRFAGYLVGADLLFDGGVVKTY